MSKGEARYKKLNKQYTDEEIVESFVFNDDNLSEEEQQNVDKEFRALRLEQLKNMTEKDRLYGNLINLKLRIKCYLSNNQYDEDYKFSTQLNLYAAIINRTKKTFAEDLGVHQTRLSRILNGRGHPNVNLMYRLEEHSGGELAAHYWWRLHALELEHKIKTDLKRKRAEAKHVKNQLLKSA